MNLKKKLRRFFTLSPRANAGFTLVELIVVIAILAILAGIGVPAYSGYVTKANQQADMTLVSEVADAMQLYYYSHPDTTGGYVVLNQEGTNANADDEVGTVAMQAVFGDSWAETATLKYDEWTDDGLLDIVTGYTPEELSSISNSTFVTVSTPESLMAAVTDMTGLVSEVVASSDFTKATDRLTALGMHDAVAKLEGLKLDPTKAEDQQEYATAVSNLMVNELSKRVQQGDGSDNLSTILFLYSSALAYGEASGDYTVLNQINTNLSGDDFTFDVLNSTEEGVCLGVVTQGLMDSEGNFNNEGFVNFGAQYEENNVAALYAMMGAIEQISGSYSDKGALTNPGLYTTDAVAEQVNNYVNAVKAVSGMDEATRQVLLNRTPGSITVFVAADGSVSVVPGAAWLAS